MARPLGALPDLSHLDDASAELILKLHLEDVETFKQQRKGKQKEGDVDDGEYAATLLEQDLHGLETFLSDRRMTKSIADAVQTDGTLLDESAQQEQTACEDRELARRLGGNPTNSNAAPPRPQPEPPVDDVTPSNLAGPYVSEETGHALASELQRLQVTDDGGNNEEEEDTRAESSNAASHRRNNNARPGYRGDTACVACQETKPFFDIIQAPCQHDYCIDCIRDLFNSSFTDESLFPPKCCRTPIPVESVSSFFFMPKQQLEQIFEEKKVEFSTANRTYCSKPTCSAFINPANISNNNHVATCQKCYTQTCSLCKAAAHGGSDTECPEDPNLQAVLDLARESGWQRCNACRRLIELNIGCNHMTCRCGAQFCYECGVRWKECECPQWRDDRLLARANQIVDRDAPRLHLYHPARAQHVQQAANLLRERHICNHTNWRFRTGEHTCEECADTLPRFIFECTQCRILVCKRCKNNRL